MIRDQRKCPKCETGWMKPVAEKCDLRREVYKCNVCGCEKDTIVSSRITLPREAHE